MFNVSTIVGRDVATTVFSRDASILVMHRAAMIAQNCKPRGAFSTVPLVSSWGDKTAEGGLSTPAAGAIAVTGSKPSRGPKASESLDISLPATRGEASWPFVVGDGDERP